MRRASQIAGSDYIHALGGLATLAIVYVVSRSALVILLTTLTPEGVQTVKNNPQRIREVSKEVEQLGASVKAQYATLGHFDFVNVVEAPDAATIARVSIALGARGSAKLQTLTALEIEEFTTALG